MLITDYYIGGDLKGYINKNKDSNNINDYL